MLSRDAKAVNVDQQEVLCNCSQSSRGKIIYTTLISVGTRQSSLCVCVFYYFICLYAFLSGIYYHMPNKVSETRGVVQPWFETRVAQRIFSPVPGIKGMSALL